MENLETNEEKLRININTVRIDTLAGGCGYCKDQLTNIRRFTSYKNYLNIKSIPVNLLQEMIIKGWARCGNSIYKSNYEKTCCKLYQPRVNINNFKISKEQKKVMKRFRKYLSGEYENNKLINKEKEIEKNKEEKIIIKDEIQDKIYQKLNDFIKSDYLNVIINKYILNSDEIIEIYDKIKSSKIRKNTNKKVNFDYSCDLIFIIKNVLIYLRKKNGTNEINNIELNNQNEATKKFINDIYNEFHKYYQDDNIIISFNENTGHINFILKNKSNNIKNNNPNSININIIKNNYIEQIKEGKKQKNKEKSNKIEEKQKYIFDYFKEQVPEPEIYLPLKHIYTLELTDKITLEENDERFLLYKKYQLAVHKELEKKVSDYNNFIGISPLEKKRIQLPKDLNLKTRHPELYPEFYGTYNLIHRIDGKIIAVTVCDILPNYLESMYCYYDPDYSFLDLGVVTAIREIEYMKSFQELIDKNFMYYSMGEMSHYVPKLRYKGNYYPTEIMDHYTGLYVLLTDEVKQLIGDNKCHHLVPNQPSLFLYFTQEEINYYFWNVIIEVFGEKITFDNFLNLYFEDIRQRNIFMAILRRLLEIVDIESFSKFILYYEIN